MKERPVIFSAEMVRAILDGRKSQTRRVIKPQPTAMPSDVQRVRGDGEYWWAFNAGKSMVQMREMPSLCPYGQPGDRLWVRETWAGDDGCGWVYRADHPTADIRSGELDDGDQVLRRWRSPIHMPRWASRITLEITGVRVERVQDITAAGAIAEGIPSRGIAEPCIASAILYIADFEMAWNALNEKRGYGWAANPWVFVIEFRRVEP